MTARPLTRSPSYLATVRGTQELQRLISEGKEDSPEAEAIRDASDGPWEALSEPERTRARLVAEDLYSLYETTPARLEMTREAQAGLNEAYEARQRGEWDRSLELLRTWRVFIDPFLVSYLRGTVWLEAGDPATAALFFQHAHKLNPVNPTPANPAKGEPAGERGLPNKGYRPGRKSKKRRQGKRKGSGPQT